MRKNAVISLELAKDDTLGVKFYAKQYDDIKIKASVYDGLDAINIEGQEVVVFIQKPDGTMIEQMKDIEIVDNEIVINLSKQATTALGECDVEVILRDGEGETSTSTVSYVVIEKLSTAVIELIQSSNDIHHLKLIEELIERADASLLSIEADIREIQAYISTMEGNINVECETILATLKALRDEIIEDINNEVHTLKNNAVDEISTLKDDSVDEISTLRDDSVDEISTLKDESIEDVDTTRNNAVDEITALKDEIVDTSNKALEDAKEAVEKAEEAVLVATETLDTASNVKAEVEKLSSDICETIEYIEDSKNRAIEEIAEAVVVVEETKEQAVVVVEETKEQAVGAINGTRDTTIGEVYATRDVVVGEVYATRDTVVGEINTAKNEAVGVINSTKDTAMGEMTAKKDALIEEISQVETGTVEGVDEAVNAAQERLQELTIQCTWEVQKTSADEKDVLRSVSGAEQRAIHEKANEQIERVNVAGAGIVEMVEGLEANIEDGLAQIEETTRSGKSEIIEMSNAEVDRIKATGAEITEAVAELEINTTNNVDRINRAGESNVNRVESVANSGIREINTISSEQKELIRDAGNEKLEEINSILGVSKGEVEELLSTTRSEINSHRVDFAERVSTAKEEIDNLKDSSIVEMTTTKDDFVDEILGAEIALKEDFKTLRDAYIKDIDDKGQLRLDALQRMIDKIDALQLAVDKKLEVSEKRAETLENTLENVDNKIAEIRPVLDNLTEMRNICVSLQQENAEARENIEELDFLHTESDTRIVELRRLIEEAKQYEAVVADYINSRGGNHEEINARLDALEEALAELEIPSIDHLATKEELEAKVGEVIDMIPEEVDLSQYATKDDISEAIENIDIPEVDLSEYITKAEVEELLVEEVGEFGNVKMTEYDAFPLAKEPPTPPEGYDWRIVYRTTDNNYFAVYFNQDPTGYILYDDSLLESKGLIRYVIDTGALPSSCAKVYRYSSSWKTNSTYPPQGMNIGNSSYGIAETYYHNFHIYDYNDRDVIRRYNYEKNLKPGTANDADKALDYERYMFDIGEDDGILNMPVVNSKGVLINDIAKDYIKQEVSTVDNVSYTRMYNGSSWTDWKKQLSEDDIIALIEKMNSSIE